MRDHGSLKYRIKIKGLVLEYFEEAEIEDIIRGVRAGSAVDGNKIDGVWFQVKSNNSNTLHLPPDMTPNFFEAVRMTMESREYPPAEEKKDG